MTEDELRKAAEHLRAKAKAHAPTRTRIARMIGAALGGMVPDGLINTSKLDPDDPTSREFAEGFEEGKLARTLGELWTAAARKPQTDEDDDP